MPVIEVPAPPSRPDAPPFWASAAIPLVGSLGTLALVVSGGRRQLLIGLALAAATLGAMALQAATTSSSRRRHLRAIRDRYGQALADAHRSLLSMPPNAGTLNIKVGQATRTFEFAAPYDDPRSDPICVAARDRFVAAYASLRDAPLLIDLATTARIPADRAHARAVVLAAAEAHPPDVLGIEVRSRDPAAWNWIALLPHHDARGSHRLIIDDGESHLRDGPRSTTVDVTQPTTIAYEPDRCGSSEAAARARRLWLPLPGTIQQDSPWTVTLGNGDDGPITVDLREAADGGIGPHGLLVGATGSGKSELLRQIIGELVAMHASDDLRLVLIDYKGGAAFTPFEDLPQVAAYVTNLADSGATHRLHEALEGELILRQRELARFGAASVREHPLPRLFVVVDEFAELLAAEPATAELFARIGRLGRSLGIHLILSTQRLDDGRLHGLESHLSYRIALRTFTAAESRLAIGSPLAAELPPHPGSGVLASGDGLRTFQAPDPATRIDTSPRPEVVSLTAANCDGPTVLADRVGRASGPPAPRLWLPPLDQPPALGTLDPGPSMHAAIGLIDRPREQRIDVLTLDLTGAAGHIAVVGGPRSGKSAALRTLAAALRRSTPDVRLLGLDLTGGLAGAVPPQRLATPRTPERMDRLLRHLRRTVDLGASPPIVVLIDGWGAMRDNYAWLDGWHQIAERGLAADVHLAVATHRWSDLRPAVRDLFGSRIELRLGDPLESEIDRRRAAEVPAKPGHGLIAPGYAIQVALDSPS